MIVENNKMVTVMYRLQVKNEAGELELMEETTPELPLQYFHGLGMMLPKFEEKLAGLKENDTFEFMLTSDEAYGPYSDEDVVDLPRNIFEIEGKIDEEKVYEGAIVPLVDSENNRINAEVVEIKESTITVDFNHPLAGEDLYFSGSIVTIVQPSEDELAAMMNPKGGCGCGCGCDSCGTDSCDSGCGCGGC